MAQERGVRYVLEGSVQRDGDRVRITAQLIDALSGRHLWAERYDREFKDIFDLQDDIARNVVTALQVKLTSGEWARALRRETDNPEPYGYLLRGRELRRHLNLEDFAQAKELYQKAAALDLDFASAWLGLASAHQIEARFGWSKNRRRSLSLANKAALKALAIDDTRPATNLALGQHRHRQTAIRPGDRPL